MLSKLFGKKSKPGPIFACAKINARLRPKARGDIFEDRLVEQLEKSKLGAVTGGGSLLDELGEIQYCGIDIDIYDREQAPAFICDVLNRRGAPTPLSFASVAPSCVQQPARPSRSLKYLCVEADCRGWRG